MPLPRYLEDKLENFRLLSGIFFSTAIVSSVLLMLPDDEMVRVGVFWFLAVFWFLVYCWIYKITEDHWYAHQHHLNEYGHDQQMLLLKHREDQVKHIKEKLAESDTHARDS